MYNLVVENRVKEVLEFLSQPYALSAHRSGAARLAKRELRGGLVFPLLFMIIGAICIIFGLTGRSYWIFVGAFGVGVGGWQFSRLLIKLRAFEVKFASDLVQACRAFYLNAYCKEETDFVSKGDQIASVLHLIPLPVLRDYTTKGWRGLSPAAIGGTAKKTAIVPNGNALSCETCGKSFPGLKKGGVVVMFDDELAKNEKTRKDLESQFLVCNHCGLHICYMCCFQSSRKELRLLCPRCGRATYGIYGLGERWKILRNRDGAINREFTLTSVDVQKTQRGEANAFDIVVRLSGTPFGEIAFRNVAVCVDDKWFLATPEPLLSDS
jgi:hypothetical protein